MDSVNHQATRRRYILRWIAVLPGALLCVFLVLFPIHWVVMLIRHFGTSADDTGSGSPLSLYYYLAAIPPDVLENLGRAFLSPFVFIVAGGSIAPKFKFQTGIVLAIGLGFLYGVGATMIADDISNGLYTPERWLILGITTLLSIAGMAVGLFQVREVDRRSARKSEP